MAIWNDVGRKIPIRKVTKQGQGPTSKPRHNKQLRRGQGK